MTRTLVVHGFETSNNMKVRVALGYKAIAYVFRTIDPSDRSAVVALSGQHLTPVMEHGDVVLFDSAAILRYLDANFPDTPRLFGTSRDEQWEIEDWELFARTRLAGPMLAVVHRRASGVVVDEALQERCGADFAAAARDLAQRLAGREWLVGDALSAADVAAAPVLHRVQLAGFFPMPPEAEALRPWRERVMAFDGPARLE
jgi:glutathione S-transferase